MFNVDGFKEFLKKYKRLITSFKMQIENLVSLITKDSMLHILAIHKHQLY